MALNFGCCVDKQKNLVNHGNSGKNSGKSVSKFLQILVKKKYFFINVQDFSMATAIILFSNIISQKLWNKSL